MSIGKVGERRVFLGIHSVKNSVSGLKIDVRQSGRAEGFVATAAGVCCAKFLRSCSFDSDCIVLF